MNTISWSDAQNWLDLLDHLWIGLVLIVGACVPSYLSVRNHRSIKDETAVIKEQLVNGHKSPLRADLDKALQAIAALAENVNGLRQDLLTERDSRRAQVDDLRADVDRMRQRNEI